MGRFAVIGMMALAFVSGCASIGSDVAQDSGPECVPGASQSKAERESCALAAIERACRTDPSQVTSALASALQVTGVQVRKAMGRHTLKSLDRGDLCARDVAERKVVIAASQQAKKVPSEAAQPWLLRELGGASGVIDHAAVSQALAQREEMLRAPVEKRAGLPANPAGWTNLAVYQQSPGRINHIVFTSGTGSDLLAGADGGGIWRSTDGGTTWNAVNDFLGSLSISSFGRAANDASTIYASTNTHGSHTYFPFGIVKSTNAGLSWSQLAQTNPTTNADFTYVQRVAVHPTNSAIVLAATDGGAYQSIDGGANWTKIGGISTTSYYVAFHPADGNKRVVAYNDGTIRYTTTGDLLGAGASTATVLAGGKYMKIAYAKSDANRMYAVFTENGTNLSRLYTSAAGAGGPWTEVPSSNSALTSLGAFFNGGYFSYTGGLWVDPTNANRVAVCEGWASFTADISAGTPVWKYLYSGWVDFHGIVEHPAYDGVANKTVFFMDDGGLYRVADIDIMDTNPSPFTQFQRMENGLVVNQVYSVAGRGGNPILGAQDTGPRAYRSASWNFVGNPAACPGCSWIGDGATAAASTANSSVLYGSRQYLDMFRSTDGGATASSIVKNSALTEGRGATTPNTNAAFIAPFVLDPSNQSRMLAGGQSLWRSGNVDSGSPPTWTAIRAPYFESACGYTAPVSVIAIAPSNPDVIWIAHECAGRVFKTVNGTQPSPTWTEVTTLPALANNRSKGAILIDATNPNLVWIGLAQYVGSTLFKTTDGGATAGAWSTIAGLPGAPIYSLAQHPNDGTWLYAATGVGLFASSDNGASWSTSNEGPANVVVKSLAWNTTGVASELMVGTFGRGVFKATVSTATLAASTTTMISSVTSPSPPTSITFTATVAGGSGTPTGNVVFRDGAVDLGTVALNGSAQAAFTTAALAVGSHSISANFQGNGTYSPSASTAFPLTIAVPNPPRLANISTRMQVLTGNDVLIGGFVIGGAASKQVAIVATGPSLVAFGIANALANPTLTLVRSSDQAVLATNDNWQSAVNAAAITASGFAPSNTLESAILTTLAPGAYTAIVSGVGGTGVGVVGVYEVDHPEIPLINISTRGQVLTGNDVMIGGFIIQGTGSQQVAIVATGPSLAAYGIVNPLANPTLTLVRSSDQAVLASNDDWQGAANAAAITASGFAPSNPLESAILITLAPGAYTAILSGVGGGTGVGVIGVYTVP